jgi:hypothetical protein
VVAASGPFVRYPCPPRDRSAQSKAPPPGAARTDPQPFTILGGKGAERKFDTLAEAVQAASDGDTIEVRGNGPFASKRIKIQRRKLTIRAGESFRPVIKFASQGDKEFRGLLETDSALVLEGLEFHHSGLVVPAAGPSSESSFVVYSWRSPLHVANCRFLVRNRIAIGGYDAPSQIRNCDFRGREPFYLRGAMAAPIGIDNNLFIGFGCPSFGFDSPVSIQLTRNTVLAKQGFQFFTDEKALQRPIHVESSANIIDAEIYCIQFGRRQPGEVPVEEVPALLRRTYRWQQQQDLFAPPRTAIFAQVRASRINGARFTVSQFERLADWNQLWGQADDAVRQGTPRYQGGDLRQRAEDAPEQLTPDDFRLRPDSAGYRAGKDGKDLGPDIDLVGPGLAYERWKKTPEYQQWLKDTGQAK